MKKIFFCLVMALMAVCAHAQVTWNVRVGVGVQDYTDYYSGHSYEYETYGLAVEVESNIPFKRGSSFTFSPSLSVFQDFDGEQLNITLPLHLGYKMFLSDDIIFCPKLGPALTYGDGFDGENFAYGPSIEIPIECKHLVIAWQAHIVFSEESHFGATFTLGYKF